MPGVGTDRVDPAAPLTSMGFDSLLSHELRKALALLRVQLPSTVAWRFPAIDGLAPYLAERMDIALDAGPAPGPGPDSAAPPPTAGTADAPAAPAVTAPLSADGAHGPVDLDTLSAADLEALLLAKTQAIDEGGQR